MYYVCNLAPVGGINKHTNLNIILKYLCLDEKK